MKAIIDAQYFTRELKKLSPVIKKNTVIPILTCVKLSFDKGNVKITASDLETTVLSNVECECKSHFSLIMEFSDLVEVCSKLSGLVTIELKDKAVIMTSNNSKFEFVKSNDEEHFPKIPEDEFSVTFDVNSDFFSSLYLANSCRSTDDFKPNMNAACIHMKNDIITLVGTDAYVAYKNDLKIKTGKQIQVMVPDQFVQMVKAASSGKISIGEKFVKAELDNTIIISRLADAKFCSYETIIPAELAFNFKANRAELVKSLGIAGVASSKQTRMCAINFNEGEVKITSEDVDFGKTGETRVKANHSVEIPAVGVSGDQMLKLLSLFDSEDIEIYFRQAGSTICIRPAGEPNTLCLLQPLMLQN